MIALLEGTIVEKSAGEVILLTGGVGFRLLCSVNTLAALPPAETRCRLFTHMSVREDALELYGFATREERELVRHLISVSGIGPKSALGVLGSLPIAELRMAILTGDVAMLSRAPGVGKKTAQRIALELKDRLTQEALAHACGVTRQTIIALEAGKYSPSLELAFRIARAFGVGVEEVFRWKSE